jgi:serine/threonine-protein phosphatase 2A regulatory subunit A
LEDLNRVIGIETLSHSLVPAINQLASEKKWRVRMTIIEYFPILAKIMGETAFNDRFGPMCLSWLDDNVFAIREAAMKNLQQLTQVFRLEMAREKSLPN